MSATITSANHRCVPGVFIGQIVNSCAGNRRFRVLKNDEFVVYQDGRREGPYCRLMALDDKSITVIFPRSLYWIHGENRELFA